MDENTIYDDVTIAPGIVSKTMIAGRYRVVRKLGEGGMGTVWLAEDTKLDDRQVAIKMLPSILVDNKRAYQQVKKEALVTLKLSHSNIATVRAFEEDNGNPFLVMDYIDGQTLDDYLAEKGTLTEDETIKLLKPVADALDYAHTQGVVHRDVKPGNVIISKDGVPFVLDFGIAREVQETMTRVTGKLSSGTLMYMSPEQLNGALPTSAQDIYSFAAMVYECLKGEPPFSRGQIEFQIINNPPPPLDAAIAISGSVMAGLKKTPDKRPKSCAAVIEPIRPARSAKVESAASDELEDRQPQSRVQTSIERGGGNRRGKFGLGRAFIWLGAVLLVGASISAIVFGSQTKIYEATSEFSIDMRRMTGWADTTLDQTVQDLGTTYVEIFNTRISDWRSERLVIKIIQRYRANFPKESFTDEELISTLHSSKLKLDPNSRTVKISVRSQDRKLCVALANAYAESIEAFTDEENKARCDKAVAQIHTNVNAQRLAVNKINQQILDLRTANKIDSLKSERDTLAQSLQTATADIARLEKEQEQLVAWEQMLEAVLQDPTSYSTLAVNVPQAQEIATEFSAYQTADGEYQQLLVCFTENHPEVAAKKKAAELARKRFIESVTRALQTGRSTLKVTRDTLASQKARQENLRLNLATTDQRIVLAEENLATLENERSVANKVLEGLSLDENAARLAAEAQNEIVRVGNPAQVPEDPVLPDPRMVFGVGLGASLVAFVLSMLIRRACV